MAAFGRPLSPQGSFTGSHEGPSMSRQIVTPLAPFFLYEVRRGIPIATAGGIPHGGCIFLLDIEWRGCTLRGVRLPTERWARDGRAPLALAVYAWRGARAELGTLGAVRLFARVGIEAWLKTKKSSVRPAEMRCNPAPESARNVEQPSMVISHE